ncbi:GntR family transcriptional regulator [Limnoglobus roseus]|uniref:LacI family transcriptional regulator n=1 Tax=Limnoglobus roseus TaxID=2598579 RepID=A0A5C1AFD8_9BACT|nr:GntR family transcriptional regulator [Limnoglobus roseus]QEL17971.1 LacI family transcriptional regulator [Limnoglobus roseus]
MPSEPKHRLISRELLAEIAADKYAPSGRLPSESQLVARFGASRPTVARALRDLQEQGLIERRAGSGSFVRNRPSIAPNALRQFGLLIPGLGTTEFFEAVCGELASLARVHEYGLFWGGGSLSGSQADATPEAAEDLCGQFVRRAVSGVFFAPAEQSPSSDAVNNRVTEQLQKAGIAVVLLDRDVVPFPARSGFDLVAADHFAGGFLLADHLLKLGCRRPCYLARPLSAPAVAARIAGAREAILRHGMAVPVDFVRVGDPDDRALVRGLTGRGGADAILCANDHLAAELLRALGREGVKVPRDVRVVGFDDVRYATLLSVPLTTVHQPCREIAATAFRAMLDRVADPGLPPRGIALCPRLVVRESCGAYLPRA